MKKILIVFTLFLTLCFTSCVEEFRGDYGLVEDVELVHGYHDEEPEFKYLVTVTHRGNACGQYKLYTNNVYHPGDTLEIKLKD